MRPRCSSSTKSQELVRCGFNPWVLSGMGSDAGLLYLEQNTARRIRVSHGQVLFTLKVKIMLVNERDFTAFRRKLLPYLHLPLWRSTKVYGADLQEKRNCSAAGLGHRLPALRTS